MKMIQLRKYKFLSEYFLKVFPRPPLQVPQAQE